ncbi:MAG: trigger factor [Firmicutes bacterium]|nr:trigger factor [Bacillota bacterium]
MTPVLVSKENDLATFTMEFTAEEFDKAVDAVYRRERGRITVDGFRKGKAPRSIIEKRYGAGIFFEDAINDMLEKEYPAALDTLGLNAVGRPDIQFGEEKIESHKGFTVTAKVAVEPEPEIKDYKGIEAERKVRVVKDEDIDRELKNLQERNSRLVSVERPAENGDTVTLDYSGFVGEEQFEGGTAENQQLELGSGAFIPGFEDQLVGVKAGEDKDVVVSFPEDYHAKDLAGKEAVFKCKVHDVKVKELPALDDDFAKDTSEFDTLDELKADIRKNQEKAAADASKYDGQNAVLEKLVEANQFTIPEEMIAEEAQQMYSEMAQQMAYQGMSIQDYLKYLDKKPEELLEEFRPEAEKKVRVRLIVKAVGKAEGLTASDEDVAEELKNMADMYKMDVEKVRESLGESGLVLLKEDVVSRKAIDLIYDNAKFTDVDPDAAKAEKKAE